MGDQLTSQVKLSYATSIDGDDI